MSKKILVFAGVTAMILGATAIQAKTTSPKQTGRNRWPTEEITGKIGMVDPAKDLVVVRDSTGVPFDLIVNNSTRIEAGTTRLTLSDLASRKDVTASVRLIPERRGDVAESIQLNR